MADCRSAALPENLAHYAGALMGFSREAIEGACYELEREEVEPYKPRFPELGVMIARCRLQQMKITPHVWIPCDKCEGMGWDLESVRQRRAERCECWLAWKRSSGKPVQAAVSDRKAKAAGE